MDYTNIPFDQGDGPSSNGHRRHDDEEWATVLTRTIGHLAAQLTVAQVRLRALASELHEQGVVAPAEVASRVRDIAVAETGGYLRENLGEALVDVIDVDALEHDLVAYLSDPDNA